MDGLPKETTHAAIAIVHQHGESAVLALKGVLERVLAAFGASGVQRREGCEDRLDAGQRDAGVAA